MPGPDTMPSESFDHASNLLPRVTIIIPNLNHGQFLEQAICSALDQGYDNAEIIVVDGGSDDDSVDIIKCYHDELAYWHSEWDSGPAEAINAALVRATGDIVCILSADDILLPGAIEDAAKTMSTGRKPKWLAGHAHRIGVLHESLGEFTAVAPESLASFLMHDTGLMPMSACFYRKELFCDYGGFRTDLSYAWSFEMQARLLSAQVEPQLTARVFTAIREISKPASVAATLARGNEFIQAADDYANHLELPQRYQLWKNCDERRRIYALAQAESQQSKSRMFLWQQLLRRPWWLGSTHYRNTLLNGVQSLPDDLRGAA